VSAGTGTPGGREAIWTGSFFAVCVVSFLGFAHNGLLTPAVPVYLHDLGASEVIVGLVLAAFSVTSFTLRPFIGRLADVWTAAGVLGIGVAILGASSFGFLLPGIGLLACANGLRGIGWGALNTGSNTLLAYVAPASRRGEASGYFSLFLNLAGSVFPVGALWLMALLHGNARPVFVLAGALPLAGVALTLLIRYRPPPTAPEAELPPTTGLANWVDAEVLPAAIPQMLMMMANPASSAFVTLFGQSLGLGLDRISWYFLASGIVAVLARGALGRLSDRFGRVAACALGFGSTVIAFALLAVADGLPLIMVAGVFYALGFSASNAATLAFAIDLANPARRGRAMATYSLSNQVGFGIGAPIWGVLIVVAGYRGMFAGAAACACVGLASVVVAGRRVKSLSRWPTGRVHSRS
jgi:MFS family permease